MKRSRCACGRVKARDSRTCTKCHNERIAECKAEALSHVQRGTCPNCGTALQPNNSILGWWQCGCFSDHRFRKAENLGKPNCGFQCFISYER